MGKIRRTDHENLNPSRGDVEISCKTVVQLQVGIKRSSVAHSRYGVMGVPNLY